MTGMIERDGARDTVEDFVAVAGNFLFGAQVEAREAPKWVACGQFDIVIGRPGQPAVAMSDDKAGAF